MHFALLGDHPDGLEMARALAATGRHELAAYSGPAVGREYLRRWGLDARPVGDPEEILADPGVGAVIVAGGPADRPAQLRRALQSERHVLCVHPADHSPDIAYEAAMLQSDSGCVLLPLLPDALHPAFRRLATLARRAGNLRLFEIERWAGEPLLLDHGIPGHRPAVPGWDVLRVLGGEVVELSAYTGPEELEPQVPLLLAGRFGSGTLFRVSLIPDYSEARYCLTALTDHGRIELSFPQGWPGHCRLTYRGEAGAVEEETWGDWNPWPALVEAFEEALRPAPRHMPARSGAYTAAGVRSPGAVMSSEAIAEGQAPQVFIEPERSVPLSTLTWQDAVRGLELDDAARRSVERRRASTLEYQDATEEASFKGTMTLVGCGLIWACLALLIVSRWVPWLGWAVLPVLAVFLGLQFLRWVVPKKEGAGAKEQGGEGRIGDQ